METEQPKFKHIVVPKTVYSNYYWLGMFIGATIGKKFNSKYKIRQDYNLNDIVAGIEMYRTNNHIGYDSSNIVYIVWPKWSLSLYGFSVQDTVESLSPRISDVVNKYHGKQFFIICDYSDIVKYLKEIAVIMHLYKIFYIEADKQYVIIYNLFC